MQKEEFLKLINKMILFEEVKFINYIKKLIIEIENDAFSEKLIKELHSHLDVLLIESANHSKWLNELQKEVMELL